jgi:aryl-alcohol dehydrogenase-like predicted oxidoreductase
MKFNNLGTTDLKVSEICLGTMTWGRQNTQDEGHAQIDYALEQGLNFMDTAEMYAVPPNPETYGKTETIIGNWFQKTGKRDKWILASKVAGGGNKWIRNGSFPSATSINEALEDSLGRLQTDYLDLYQVHWASRRGYNFDQYWSYRPEGNDYQRARDHIFEMAEALDKLIKSGKVRHVGISNETAWGMMQYLTAAERKSLVPIVSIQNEYSMLRRHFDHDLAEVCISENVGLLSYSPLAAGVLTGKYFDGAMPKGSRGDISGGLFRNTPQSEAATKQYFALAAKHGLDPIQMALAFCISRPFMASTIIGATSMEQLTTNIGAANVTLTQEVLDEIDAIHRAFPRPI